MLLRVLIGIAVAACGGPAYQLSIQDSYEVGEDPTISLQVREARERAGELVLVRPDGSTVKQPVPLDREQTYVRFGTPGRGTDEPTFTSTGDYRVELRTGETVLARQEIRISTDRLTHMFDDEEIAGFRLVARYTRARQDKGQRWKTYAARYEHTLREDSRIQVVIEQPGPNLQDAWKPYEEEGTLAVIENNNVRFRERTRSVSASWISGKRIIAMRAGSLDDFERGFIGYFLAKYPSALSPK